MDVPKKTCLVNVYEQSLARSIMLQPVAKVMD